MAPTSTAQAESAKRKVPSAVERRGDLARKARRPARPLQGILKKPRLGQHKLGGGPKKVKFNLKPRRPGPGYADNRKRRDIRKMLERRSNMARAARKPARGLHRGARHLAAGTGVGAVVGVTAGLAGVDPVEMAALKATSPAEYERRMRVLKKKPMKYMGKNIKSNTKKIGRRVKNGTRKFGQGVKKVFAKRKK